MHYPELAALPCTTCKRYMIDYDWDTHTGTGQIKRWGKSPEMRAKFQERAAGVPMPCDRCPKESPEKEHEHVLSEKNERTYSVYLEVQASFGQCLGDEEREDALLRRNLAIVGNIARQVDQDRLAEKIARRMPILRRAGE